MRITDTHGTVNANICCEPCLGGDGHSPECEAVASAVWRQQRQERRQEQRQRRRATTTTPGPTRGGGGGGGSAGDCAPASVDLGGGAVLGPPDAGSDPTGLQALIDANGGPESFKHLRDDERPLGAVLSAREDTSFLKSP